MSASREEIQKKIVDDARHFSKSKIQPLAKEFDAQGALGRDLIKKLAEKRFLLPSMPKQYGGLDLDPVHHGLFKEQISKGCCSTGTLITVQNSLLGETLLKWGSEEQKKKYLLNMSSGKKLGAFALSEPEVGSDAHSIQTSYDKRGDRFIINGKKKWISFAEIAGFFVVIARNANQVSSFIIDRDAEGITVKPQIGLLAGRAMHVSEIEFKNTEVPASNLLGRLGAGYQYIVGTALDHGRYAVAWAGVAIAQACVEAVIHYSRNRKQFDKLICEHQLVQGMIGDAIASTHAARALCLKAAAMRRDHHQDAMIETTIAKYMSSKLAMQVATDAVQIHGGNGFSNKYPVERLFREAKLLEVIEGTSQLQQQIIAKYGLRKSKA